MKTMTVDQREAIRALPEASARLAVKVQRAAGFDVAEFAHLLPSKPAAPPRTDIKVSTIGDRVKAATAWTGIRECQRCSALRKKLNGLDVEQVRAGIDGFAADLLSNLVALANGEAVDLAWWDRKTAQAKAKVALTILGEDNVLARCRALILTACDDEQVSLGLPVVGSADVRVGAVEVQDAGRLPARVVNGGRGNRVLRPKHAAPEDDRAGQDKGHVDEGDDVPGAARHTAKHLVPEVAGPVNSTTQRPSLEAIDPIHANAAPTLSPVQ